MVLVLFLDSQFFVWLHDCRTTADGEPASKDGELVSTDGAAYDVLEAAATTDTKQSATTGTGNDKSTAAWKLLQQKVLQPLQAMQQLRPMSQQQLQPMAQRLEALPVLQLSSRQASKRRD